MGATLPWLDHDAAERDRMLRILSLFQERETRDELGVGVIRDLIADDLFPGPSTIQTRLRYVLFIPWLYQELEAAQCPSSKVASDGRKREIALVSALLQSDDNAGVLGKRAGGQLARYPVLCTGRAWAPGGCGDTPARRSSITSSLTPSTAPGPATAAGSAAAESGDCVGRTCAVYCVDSLQMPPCVG